MTEDSCREYLGSAGYCPREPAATDPVDGRRFCSRHAAERGLRNA